MPLYAWILVLTADAGIIAAVGVLLWRTAHSGRLGLAATAALTAWALLSGALAAAGAYRISPAGLVPWLGVALVAVVLALLASARLPAVRRALEDPAIVAWFALPHTFRVVAGAGFLLLYADGRLPALFALPAGLGDIAVGLAAPFLAARLARDPEGGRAAAVRFNLLGILDLVVAVGMGVANAPGPLRPDAPWPGTASLGDLPLALIPTVGVAIAVALHVLALRRLRSNQPVRLSVPVPSR